MKVKYKEGDVFVIPLSNGKYAICKVVFAPKGKFKKIISFCVLSIQHDEIFINDGIIKPISFEKFGKKTQVLFTGNQNISNGLWKVIDCVDLTEDEVELKVFNYAGGLYNGETEIRRIPIAEYPNYTAMGVSGFELVDNILTSI
ncbi:Imm26 family immunity protein [Pantoea sp. A4]|uniref:Imm26 family immunity protein n=1 Tax=Pantoea sp. A4 TaxID=1225184 RepID=UPI00035D2CCF|nr:Imm26 family immunity protein [Pantoea sp. A4]